MGKLSQQARMNEAAVADLNATMARIDAKPLSLASALKMDHGIKAQALALAYDSYCIHGSWVRFNSEVSRILDCNVERMEARRG